MLIEKYELFLKPEWIEQLTKINIIDAFTYNSELENLLKYYIDVSYVALTSNGTSAIYLGMIALGLKAGDEIIIPNFSYPSVKICAEQLHLKIKYCDIKTDTFCMNPEYLKTIISKDTKAVCFINHLGYVGEDLIEIKNICDSYGVLFFEDSAQGLGQFYNKKMAGTFGNFGILSFSGAKTISSGEGGAIFSNNISIIENVRKLQSIELNGIGNYSMSALCSFLIKKQMEDLDNIFDNKIRIFNEYMKHIELIKPFKADNFIGYNSIVYYSDLASEIYKDLKSMSIKSRYKFYPIQKNLVNSKIVFDNYLELPHSFILDDKNIKFITNIIKKREKN